MKQIHFFTCLLFLIFYNHSFAQKKHNLKSYCIRQQLHLKSAVLTFEYKEINKSFFHSFEPWQHYTNVSNGQVFYHEKTFFKVDSVKLGKETIVTKTFFADSLLLIKSGSDTSFKQVKRSDYMDEFIEICRFTPELMAQKLLDLKVKPQFIYEKNTFIYTAFLNQTQVSLVYNATANLVEGIKLLQAHPIFGDIESKFSYTNYTSILGFKCPQTVIIEKFNHKLVDTIQITHALLVQNLPEINTKPADFIWENESIIDTSFVFKKYTEHLYTLDIINADSRTLIVEFSDFLVVVDAPLSVKNGELILQIAKLHFSTKPIKYFVFGHHHPWSIGGLRAMVNDNVTVICNENVQNYLKELCEAPRRIEADAQFINPKPIKIQLLKDSLTIKDAAFEMKLYLIGKQSNHTNDYTIFYFPSEKLLFEDDLIWIKKDSDIKKAGSRQEGLYHAVKTLDLDVKQVMQSWPQTKYGLKNMLEFSELENTVNFKK